MILDLQKRLVNLSFYRGRVALYSILKALGIGDRDHEVITQAFTCIAVPEAIKAAGARPVYVDLEKTGFNMDVEDLDSKITSQTRAIIVQHTYGIPANMDRIVEVSKKHRLPIIEDCCHTLESSYKGKKVGTFGVASFYSFEWGKPVMVGIGGSALINDPILERTLQSQYAIFKAPPILRQGRLQLQYLAHRILYRPRFYWPVRDVYRVLGSWGAAESNYHPVNGNQAASDYSLRMSTHLQKRLMHKLRNVEEQVRHSRWVTDQYQAVINSSIVALPDLSEVSSTVFARYPLIAQDKTTLLTQARKGNVELADWYSTPVHPLTKDEWPLVDYDAESCPNAEQRCKQVVTLPVHSAVKSQDVSRFSAFLKDIAG